MCKVEEELPTPPEILETVKILAPESSPPAKIITAMRLAVDLYQAKLKPPSLLEQPPQPICFSS